MNTNDQAIGIMTDKVVLSGDPDHIMQMARKLAYNKIQDFYSAFKCVIDFSENFTISEMAISDLFKTDAPAIVTYDFKSKTYQMKEMSKAGTV